MRDTKESPQAKVAFGCFVPIVASIVILASRPPDDLMQRIGMVVVVLCVWTSGIKGARGAMEIEEAKRKAADE